MCRALELADLGRDPRFVTNPGRLAHKEDLLAAMGARLRALTAAEAIRRLENAGVPVGPVSDLAAVLHDPEVLRRQMVVPIERAGHPPAAVVNSPWKVDGAAPSVRREPPRLGEHNPELVE